MGRYTLTQWLAVNGGASKLALQLSTDSKKVSRQSINEKEKRGWVVVELTIDGEVQLRMLNPKHFIKVSTNEEER